MYDVYMYMITTIINSIEDLPAVDLHLCYFLSMNRNAILS